MNWFYETFAKKCESFFEISALSVYTKSESIQNYIFLPPSQILFSLVKAHWHKKINEQNTNLRFHFKKKRNVEKKVKCLFFSGLAEAQVIHHGVDGAGEHRGQHGVPKGSGRWTR